MKDEAERTRMTNPAESFPYSFPVTAKRVVDKDETLTVQPDEAALKHIASTYDLLGLPALAARFTLKPYRKEGVRVVGTLKARIRQTCVVSLEPFETDLALEVDRTFEPVSSRPRKIKDLNDDGEIEIDLDSLDPPDVMMDGVLDLGAVICEELALSLDTFPRKPGAEFGGGTEAELEVEDDSGAEPSPFAALKALKDKAED